MAHSQPQRIVYATFLNETITLEDALGMDATKILSTFDGIAKKPESYQVLQWAQPYMKNAVLQIRAIHDHYNREKNKRCKTHPGYIVDSSSRLSSLEVAYQSRTFNLRTLYDIVAWILSVVGPVPVIARRDNYFYPLMMIGYVFSEKLIPTEAKPEGVTYSVPGAPAVWTVMWFKQKVGKKQVVHTVVGTTLDQPGKATKDIAKDFRKGLLKESDILGWDPDAPSIEQKQRPGAADFGHCAETYPLLFICSLGTGKKATAIQRSVEGLAAKAPMLYNSGRSTIMSYPEAAKVRNALMNPCLNCEWLLGYGAGFKISNFLLTKRKFFTS